MGLVPVAWLALHGERRAEWWWLAAAFGISWLADLLAQWQNPWLVSAVYPVSQAAIIAAVLLARREALLVTGVLVLAGTLGVFLEGVHGPDMLVETVAAGVVVGLVWPRPLGRLKSALLVAFGGCWLAWLGYLVAPGFETWGMYQLTRALGLGLFCWASLRPHPRLGLA